MAFGSNEELGGEPTEEANMQTMTDDEADSAPLCELCPRMSEVGEDASLIAGWVLTWDGWLCPKCASTFSEEPPNTK